MCFFFFLIIRRKQNKMKNIWKKIRNKENEKFKLRYRQIKTTFCYTLHFVAVSIIVHYFVSQTLKHSFLLGNIHYPRDYRSYILVHDSTQKNVSLPPNIDQLWESSYSTEQRALSPLHDTPDTQDHPHRQNGSLLS